MTSVHEQQATTPTLRRTRPQTSCHAINDESGTLQSMNDLGPHVLEWLGWVGDDGPHYPVKQRSEATTFLRFLESLSTYGRGYAEVARADQPFPMLALSAAPGRAVVH